MKMASKAKKVSWEDLFLFPTVGKKYLDDPICLWKNDKWTMFGKAPIGIARDDVDTTKRVTAVVWGPRKCNVVGADGTSYPFPREFVEHYVHGTERYYVCALPSVYPVDTPEASFKVLACFGYNPEDDSVLLFNVRDLQSEVWDVMITPRLEAFHPKREAPAYSPTVDLTKTPKAFLDMEKARGEALVTASKGSYVPPSVADYFAVQNKADAVQSTSSAKGQQLTGIAQGDVIVQGDGEIWVVKRKRSTIIKESAIGVDNLAGREYIKRLQMEARAKNGIKEDGVLPLPIPRRGSQARNVVVPLPLPRAHSGFTPPGAKAGLLGDDHEIL